MTQNESQDTADTNTLAVGEAYDPMQDVASDQYESATGMQAREITAESGMPLWLRATGELAGSFLVCFSIYVASAFATPLFSVNLAFIVVMTAAAYAAVTLIFGGISGGQFNPAVTIAAMLTTKTRIVDGIVYIVVQVLGGVFAGLLLRGVAPSSKSLPAKLWFTYVVNGFDDNSIAHMVLSNSNTGVSFGITMAIVVEVVAGIIIVAAAMRTLGRHGESSSKHVVAMGLAYGVGTAMTYPITGAALNPARSTGIAIAAQNQGLSQQPLQQLWVFWVAPVLAAALVALVMVAQEIFSGTDDDDQIAETEQGNEEGSTEFSFTNGQNSAHPFALESNQTDEHIDFTNNGPENSASINNLNKDDASQGAAESTEHLNAEVRDEQTDAQSDTDEGIETD